jgi:hypothetical protein
MIVNLLKYMNQKVSFTSLFGNSLTILVTFFNTKSRNILNLTLVGFVLMSAQSNRSYGSSFENNDSLKTASGKPFSPFQLSVIQLSSIYAVRTAIYLNTGGLQDNDYETWSIGFSERFKSKNPYRFDDNHLFINHVGHAMLPAYETAMFRINGMGFYSSFGLQFAASGIWEFVIEAKETVSLNDVLETPIAGASISETLFQFAQFYRRGAPTRHNKLMGALFSGPLAFNYWLNGTKRKASDQLDIHGYDAKEYHLFKSHMGASLYNSGFIAQVGTEMEVVNIPNYKEPGVENRFYMQPIGADFALSLGSDASSAHEIKLLMQTQFATFHSKNISRDISGKVQGTSFLIGAASGFEINYAQFPNVTDNLITVHMLGIGADVSTVNAKTRFGIKAKLYGDYASVSSQAMDNYILKYGGLYDVKHTLREGYYHAFGPAVLSDIEFKHGRFLLGSKIFWAQYASLEGFDRHQHRITNDFHMTDRRFNTKVWIAYLPTSNVELQFGFDNREWKSTIANEEGRNVQMDLFFGRVVWVY